MTLLAKAAHIRRTVRLFLPPKRSLIIMLGAWALIQGLTMLGPYFTQLLVDRAYPAHSIALVHIFVLAAGIITTAAIAIRSARTFLDEVLATQMHLRGSVEFYKHIIHLRIDFFDEHRSGETSSRFLEMHSALRTALSSLQTLATNSMFILLVPLVLFARSIRLAVIATVAIPIIVWLTYEQQVCLYRNAKRSVEQTAELQAFRSETFVNIRSLKGLASEEACYRRMELMTTRLAALQRDNSKRSRLYSFSIALAKALTSVACTWFGWHLILTGRLTLGEFIAFTFYLGYLYNPLSELVGSVSSVQQSFITFERVRECLQRPREDALWLGCVDGSPKKASAADGIRLDNVDFQYPSQSRLVLEHATCHLAGHGVCFVIGPSGSGKTTLLRLLAGFDRPTAGRILFGDTPISDLCLSDLRSQISVMWQDPGLMSGSLWDNLTIGAPRASRERVDQIVNICQLDTFIGGLADGYQTRIGEGGKTLSGGQEQRIAIARTLLRDTPVMMFDEATANIDFETEQKILQFIFTEFRQRLILFVTHRTSSALLGDKILLCRDGALIDVTELVKKTVEGSAAAALLLTAVNDEIVAIQSGDGALLSGVLRPGN